MNNHQLINQTSGKTEWYTDPEILAAARRLMGTIDLDPASSAAANKHVQAKTFFATPSYRIVGQYETTVSGKVFVLPVRDYENMGGVSFGRRWHGKVWLNHPFGQLERACTPKCTKRSCIERGWHTAWGLPGSADWIQALISYYHMGVTTEALCLCFSATSEAWFQPLKRFPQIHIAPRLNYFDPDGNKVSGVTKGSCLTYLGKNVEGFAREFARWGIVQVPYGVTL